MEVEAGTLFSAISLCSLMDYSIKSCSMVTCGVSSCSVTDQEIWHCSQRCVLCRGLKLGKQDYNQQLLCNSLSASTAVITNGSAPYRDDKWNDKYSSMMEQLVPEIMQHTLSYLDYQSLCNMSMTNSVIRRAASDDSAWKSLFHKVLTFSGVDLFLYLGSFLLGEGLFWTEGM